MFIKVYMWWKKNQDLLFVCVSAVTMVTMVTQGCLVTHASRVSVTGTLTVQWREAVTSLQETVSYVYIIQRDPTVADVG